jgi:hypothetical protein
VDPPVVLANPFATPPGPDGAVTGKANQDVTLTSERATSVKAIVQIT